MVKSHEIPCSPAVATSWFSPSTTLKGRGGWGRCATRTSWQFGLWSQGKLMPVRSRWTIYDLREASDWPARPFQHTDSNLLNNINLNIRMELMFHQKKFRSQTSDNMDRWKSSGGKSQRREEQKREGQRRERLRRKKIQVREKVAKPPNTVFFQWFVAPEGRKVGSLKRRVRSHAARWEMKSCTPLWREAHFQVKMYKTHQVWNTFGSCDVEKCTALWRKAHVQVKMYKAQQGRSTFGSCDVQKGHAVVAQSACPSQNVQNTAGSEHFWKLRCRKSARRCGAKHISKSKSVLNWQVRSTFGRSDVVLRGRRKGLCTLSKVAGVGHLKRIVKDAFSVAGAVQETRSSEMLGGPGTDFLRGVHFGASDLQFREQDCVWQVQHFVWPGITFAWQAQ